MANNAFNFKGLYDKVAGLLKTSDIQEDYTPAAADYIAIYKNIPGSPIVGGNTIAMKEYVPVTEIGGGSGPSPDNVMENFTVIGAGGVAVNVDGGTYSAGPVTISNISQLGISATSIFSGLNWEGSYSSATTYQLNDVVSNVDPTSLLYSTWLYINETPAAGQALPTGSATYNTYWAQLGTQGPPGSQGPVGLPSATATFGFVPKPVSGGPVVIAVAGNVGTSGNDIGKILLVNNSSTTTEAVVTVASNTAGDDTSAAGWPYNSQITVINISDEDRAPVRVTAVNGVDLRSADGAQYLRTQYSTCSIVRRSENEYYMFGDLTNIS